MMIIKPIILAQKCNGILLRSPEISEAESLLNYFRKLFHESSQFLNFPSNYYDDKNKEGQEKFIEEFNKSPYSFVLLAFIGQEIVGHIIIDGLGFERANHRAKLVMGVLNKVQDQGLGSQLVNYSLFHAESAGLVAIELQVKSFNSKAIALYEKFNFERVGCIQAAARIDSEYYDEFLYQFISPAFKLALKSSKSDKLPLQSGEPRVVVQQA